MQFLIDTDGIKKIIPQREPFLFLDGIVSKDDCNTSCSYTFRADDPVFKGHFPSEPVVPGVLLIECLAQAGAYAILSKPENDGFNAYLRRVNNAKFTRVVRPGERIDLTVTKGRSNGPLIGCRAVASVAGETAVECELTCVLIKRNKP